VADTCRVKKDFAAAALKAKESKAAGKEVPVDIAALMRPKDSVEEKLFDNGKVTLEPCLVHNLVGKCCSRLYVPYDADCLPMAEIILGLLDLHITFIY
jgi:hypothetical protein